MFNMHSQRYQVAAKTPSGAIQLLTVAAADAETAARSVERQGLRVMFCEQQAGLLSARADSAALRPQSRLDVTLFSHELASLLESGLGIIEALETLAEKDGAGATNKILGRLVTALQEGQKLSVAMMEMPQHFPPLLIASVASSEQTGDLVSALKRYAANAESMRNLRAKVVGAAVYPLILFAVGMLVVAFLLGVVVPKFSQLIESSHSDIPPASRILISMGSAISLHPALAAVSFATICSIIVLILYRAARSGWNQSWLQRLPMAGRLIRMFRHAQFYRTCGMLIEGGIPAVRALEMSGALLSPEDRRSLASATLAVREGQSLPDALSRAGLADAVASRMLTVSQRTGQLAAILGRIASFQEMALTRAIDLATRLFEPMLMLFIGLVIGAIVVLMYLPIFDLASSIQ